MQGGANADEKNQLHKGNPRVWSGRWTKQSNLKRKRGSTNLPARETACLSHGKRRGATRAPSRNTNGTTTNTSTRATTPQHWRALQTLQTCACAGKSLGGRTAQHAGAGVQELAGFGRAFSD
jgi:hypothetical protein